MVPYAERMFWMVIATLGLVLALAVFAIVVARWVWMPAKEEGPR
jgi:hypothetical protein